MIFDKNTVLANCNEFSKNTLMQTLEIEFIDAKKVMDFIATLESDVKTTSKDSGNKEKSCGLFGVELPLIIFLGFNGKRKRNFFLWIFFRST